MVLRHTMARLGVDVGMGLGLALLLCGLPLAAIASTLNVAPTRLQLAPNETSGTVQIRNSGDRIAIMQARVFKWTQAGNADDDYAPTQSLIVTPAVFSIAPGQVQVLRVGVRSADVGTDVEQSYRLLMKEVPPTDVGAGSGPGLRVALQINMPVFVMPVAEIRQDTQWNVERLDSDRLRLTVANKGNAHLQINQLNLAAQGKALGLTDSAPSLMYVLPGQTQSWVLSTLKPLPGAGQTIQVNAETNRGASHEQLTLGS